jgi:hypothetical protein
MYPVAITHAAAAVGDFVRFLRLTPAASLNQRTASVSLDTNPFVP